MQHFSTSNRKIAIQWNIRGLFGALPELQLLLNEEEHLPISLAFQETFINSKNQNSTILSNFTFYHKTRPTVNKGGVCIAILKNFPHTRINLSSELEICAARLDGPLKITLASIYIPPSHSNDNLKKELEDIIKQLPPPFILMGDFNAKHTQWGNPINDRRGKIILELTESLDITILNDKQQTRMDPHSGTTSAIDLTIASVELLPKISIEVDRDPRGSDHFPIHVRSFHIPPEISFRPKWKYDLADWNKFQDLVSISIPPNNHPSIDNISEAIISAAIESIPRSSGKPARKVVPWWNSDVYKAIKLRRKTLRKLRRLAQHSNERPEALRNFQAARSAARKVIAEAKRNCWLEFIGSLNPQTNTAELWRRVNCISGKRSSLNFTLQIDGNTIEDTAVIAEHLSVHFARINSSSNYDEDFLRTKNQMESIPLASVTGSSHEYNQSFSIEELLYAIKKGKGKSVGPDDIGYLMIKNLPYHVKLSLLEAFNSCWTSNSYPRQWRESIIIPIPKQSHKAASISNYRPISLISCVSKTMERMVNRRLLTLLEEKNLLDTRQHAFRKGKGTGSYFCSLDDYLEHAINNNLHCELALLDIEKAYDRTWKWNVLNILNSWGIEGHLFEFIRFFLGDRYFKVSIGGKSSGLKHQENGIPQGSVLSVTLFLIAMEPLFRVIPENVEALLYADDILLLSKGPFPFSTKTRLQKAINAVVDWAKSIGFKISAEKSQSIHCCKISRHKRNTKLITVNNKEIENTRCAKILGVYLDNKLNFNRHISHALKEATNRLRVVKAIGGRSKIGDRKTITNIGKSLILSKLSYGIELYSRADWSSIDRLTPKYNSIIRLASGAFRSSPISSLLAEAGELPLKYVLIQYIINRAVKHQEKSADTSTIITRANKWLRDLTDLELPGIAALSRIGDRHWNDSFPVIDWSIKNELRAGENKEKTLSIFNHLIDTKYKEHQRIYTDGSVADNLVGIGIYSINSEHNFQLTSTCSIFSAEAAALNFAASSINDNTSTVVFSDSASVLSALQKGNSNHAWVQQIEINATNKAITFCWIPGHRGISGNEKADYLANLGRQATIHNLTNPSQDISRHVRSSLRNKWEKTWLENRHDFLRKIKNTTIPWTDNRKRQYQKCLTRLRIGHTRLTHQYLFDRSDPPTCEQCNERLTVEHILLYCKKYHAFRKIIGINNSIRTVLARDPTEENKIIMFLNETGLIDKI